ncbi:MAG: acetyltransferase [Bryobacteraceae bacterium]
MTGRTPLLILGAGDFAVEAADIAEQTGLYEVAGFVQNLDPTQRGAQLAGLPVYWVEEISAFTETHKAICAIGSAERRGLVEAVAAHGFRFATVVHPSAVVSPRSQIEEGCLVSPGVVIGACTRVGRQSIVNRGALVGHHVEIGEYATIGPGANIAGSCRIGKEVFLGMGAVIRDHLTLGARAFLGAGVIATKHVEEGGRLLAPHPISARRAGA